MFEQPCLVCRPYYLYSLTFFTRVFQTEILLACFTQMYCDAIIILMDFIYKSILVYIDLLWFYYNTHCACAVCLAGKFICVRVDSIHSLQLQSITFIFNIDIYIQPHFPWQLCYIWICCFIKYVYISLLFQYQPYFLSIFQSNISLFCKYILVQIHLFIYYYNLLSNHDIPFKVKLLYR